MLLKFASIRAIRGLASPWRRLRTPRLFEGIGALVLLAGLAGCTTLPQTKISLAAVPAEQRVRAEENLRVFHAVWDLVNRKHFDPKTAGPKWEAAAATFGPRAAAAADEKALYRVLNDMLGGLNDSHTRAFPPHQATERKTQVRPRTGFNLVRLEEKWVVTEVLPGSPAELAGVRAGWIVVKVNGQPLGPNFDFRPRVGEVVQWEFLDAAGRAVQVAPVAQSLSFAPRQVERALQGGFVYLRFDGFDTKDRRWLGQQLRQHAAAPGVVIDLRRNPGGDTFSLGTAVGEFFDRAVDCGTFITRSGARSIKNSWQLGSANYAGRVVILIDGATGSAAEIFAAVLQDHGRAKLVGRKTAGAVLASWFYRLPGGGELQLSREDYIAPKGRRPEGNGIEPDVTVQRTLADLRQSRDPDLEAALKLLRGE